MHVITPVTAQVAFRHLLAALLLACWLSTPALATTPPPATGRPLGEALNPDGTLKPGTNGSFDARQFRMGTAPDGRPVFRPAGTKGAGDERWQDGFGVSGNGINTIINALAIDANGNVYAGGFFTQAGSIVANQIAKWNGTAWSSLGTGTANGITGAVYALAVAGNGDVYAGGVFAQAGGAAANNVAKWNGTAWSSLGTGTGNGVSGGNVNALAVAGNGDVYVGGGFTQAGGAAALRVAKWDGTAWSSLGTGTGNGVNSTVEAVAVAGNGDVYVGGRFTQAGGTAARRVARWDGTAWNTLGAGVTNGGFVYALAVAGNGDVYAGGEVGITSGGATIRVARWNGTAWSALGAGVGTAYPQAVYALALAANGDVYVGGNFTQASGVATNYVAHWNGSTWSSLGTGTNGLVTALAPGPTGKLYAGGVFTTTGDGSKAMSCFGIYDPNAPLATAAAKAVPWAGQLYPNPAHGTATLRLPATAPRQPLTLTDALGRVVRRYPAPATVEAELDLRGLPAGSYVVRCGAVSQRLVVE